MDGADGRAEELSPVENLKRETRYTSSDSTESIRPHMWLSQIEYLSSKHTAVSRNAHFEFNLTQISPNCT